MGVGPEHGTNQNLHELPTSGYGFWVCYPPIRGTGRPLILCLLLNVVTESLRCVFILACCSDFEGKETKAQQKEGATRGVRGEERRPGGGSDAPSLHVEWLDVDDIREVCFEACFHTKDRAVIVCCFRRHGACSCSSSEVCSAQGIAKEDPLPAVLESKSIPLVATRQHVKLLILISMLTGHMQKQRRAHYGAGGNVAEIQLCWILALEIIRSSVRTIFAVQLLFFFHPVLRLHFWVYWSAGPRDAHGAAKSCKPSGEGADRA